MCLSKGSESVANLLRRDLTIHLQAFHQCETLLLTGRNAAFIHRRPKLLLRWAGTFRTGANGKWEQQWAARIITV